MTANNSNVDYALSTVTPDPAMGSKLPIPQPPHPHTDPHSHPNPHSHPASRPHPHPITTPLVPLHPVPPHSTGNTALQLELQLARQEAADATCAVKFLLKINSSQPPDSQAQPNPNPDPRDAELQDVRARYAKLELECQSLKDQVAYWTDKDKVQMDGEDGDGAFSKKHLAGKSRDEGNLVGEKSRGREQMRGENVDSGERENCDDGLALQPPLKPLQPVQQERRDKHSQAGRAADAAEDGCQRAKLQPPPMGVDGKDLMTKTNKARVTAIMQSLLDVDHHEQHAEVASILPLIPTRTATPTSPVGPAPPVPQESKQELDANVIQSAPIELPINESSREEDQVPVDQKRVSGTFTPWELPRNESPREEHQVPVEQKRVSATFTAWEEGIREWDDEYDKPKLPPVMVLDPAYDLPKQYPYHGDLGFRYSRHNSSGRPNQVSNILVRDKDLVRWQPSSKSNQTSHRVIITNLPDNITPDRLLAEVCGGMVVSCQLLDTRALTGGPSALIRFYDGNSALAFTKYARNDPICFNDASKTPVRARVDLLSTPSFPLSARQLKGIQQSGHTRCLMIRNFPLPVDTEEAVADLKWFLRPYAPCKIDFVERVEDSRDGTVYLAFTSVDAAVAALERFSANRVYGWALARFVQDPCDRPAKAMVPKEEKSGEEGGAKGVEGVLKTAQVALQGEEKPGTEDVAPTKDQQKLKVEANGMQAGDKEDVEAVTQSQNPEISKAEATESEPKKQVTKILAPTENSTDLNPDVIPHILDIDIELDCRLPRKLDLKPTKTHVNHKPCETKQGPELQQPALPLNPPQPPIKMNPDEIDLDLDSDFDLDPPFDNVTYPDRDLDNESVAPSSRDGALTPSDSSSDAGNHGDDEKEVDQKDEDEEMNPDEIDLNNLLLPGRDHDDESVAPRSRDGVMTPPHFSLNDLLYADDDHEDESDQEEDQGTDQGVVEQKDQDEDKVPSRPHRGRPFVQTRWDYARERELQQAAERRASVNEGSEDGRIGNPSSWW